MFLQQQTQTQQWCSNREMVFSVVLVAAVATQWRDKNISAAPNPGTIEKLFFCVVSAERL
jgi:hypothetical protein